jgi:hypothetical protein
LHALVIGIFFSIIVTYIFGMLLIVVCDTWTTLNLILYVVLSVTKNDGDFGVALWPSDETTLHDDIYDGKTWNYANVKT